jgi:hypothetical protein
MADRGCGTAKCRGCVGGRVRTLFFCDDLMI